MIYCFTKNLICHHDDYCQVINEIHPTKNIKFFWPKVRILLSKKRVVLMDIDTRDLKFIPLLMLRSLWGAKSIAISVSTEYLKNSRTFYEFITKGGRVLYLRSVRNRILFKTIKHLTKTDLYSIHKNSKDQEYFSHYVKGFFYDPQLWDAKAFEDKIQQPIEIEKLPIPINNYILFLGTFDERRSRTEYLNFLKKNNNFHFLMACVCSPEDELLLRQYDNVFLINRFITNEELFYLFKSCNVVYCFYTNQRPSGFFGRAMQLSKYIIVRSNTFLSTYFKDYTNLIPISKLDELKVDAKTPAPKDLLSTKFDDSLEFRRIIEAL